MTALGLDMPRDGADDGGLDGIMPEKEREREV